MQTIILYILSGLGIITLMIIKINLCMRAFYSMLGWMERIGCLFSTEQKKVNQRNAYLLAKSKFNVNTDKLAEMKRQINPKSEKYSDNYTQILIFFMNDVKESFREMMNCAKNLQRDELDEFIKEMFIPFFDLLPSIFIGLGYTMPRYAFFSEEVFALKYLRNEEKTKVLSVIEKLPSP